MRPVRVDGGVFRRCALGVLLCVCGFFAYAKMAVFLVFVAFAVIFYYTLVRSVPVAWRDRPQKRANAHIVRELLHGPHRCLQIATPWEFGVVFNGNCPAGINSTAGHRH